MSSQRYRPNQQLEIYNFRVVPGLQISKEVDFFYDLYAHFFIRRQGGSAKPEIRDFG